MLFLLHFILYRGRASNLLPLFLCPEVHREAMFLLIPNTHFLRDNWCQCLVINRALKREIWFFVSLILVPVLGANLLRITSRASGIRLNHVVFSRPESQRPDLVICNQSKSVPKIIGLLDKRERKHLTRQFALISSGLISYCVWPKSRQNGK